VTRAKPPSPTSAVPRHLAVVMDGNGRWARQRHRPRAFGHRQGVRAARRIVRATHQRGIEVLTLFAFSQENWRRPQREVSLLMQLFVRVLSSEIDALHGNGVRIRFIGDHGEFPDELRRHMSDAEALTAANGGLVLQVAAGYGGQWDIAQAAQRACAAGEAITPQSIERHLVTADFPPPDLLIRTGGERRLSNFLLWQLAYAELYFCDTLWPDFDEQQLDEALLWFAGRERRFGRVPEAH
jgi:undecaprenyl diphosphate synthase